MCQQQEIRAGVPSFGSRPACGEQNYFQRPNRTKGSMHMENDMSSAAGCSGFNMHTSHLRILLKMQFPFGWSGVKP